MENATPIPHDDSLPSSNVQGIQRGHETSDARLRPIVIFAVAMFGGVAIIQLAVWGLMRAFEHGNEKSDPTASPFVDSRTPPTVTPMQPSIGHPNEPYEDMAVLRERWNRELTSYGPVPGRPELVRIPLQEAMNRIVLHGLSTPSSRPTTLPGGLP